VLAHGGGCAEQAYASLRVKFSRAAVDHHDAVVYSDLRNLRKADAAKSVLWKADQALGVLADQIRAH